jgi:site-specific DNA-methyltransferase (adenine-specific)
MIQLYNEDCLDTLGRMEDNTIDLVVTSPPYDNMRQYGGGKTYHSRIKDTEYSFDFENIATELTRTLKEGGQIVWNVADQILQGTKSGNSMRQCLYFQDTLGLRLHDHIIWKKTGTPFPSQYRYRNIWENIFVFSKGKPTTFNPIYKKNKTAGDRRSSRSFRNHNGEFKLGMENVPVKEFGIDDNVWLIKNGMNNSYTLKELRGHPAIMPEELAARTIYSYSNPDELVYDPFMGSATTGRVARKLGRSFTGSEIHTPYYELAKQTIDKDIPLQYEWMSTTKLAQFI